MTDKKKYISRDPKIMGGTPVIAGTRIPVSRILFLLKDGYTVEAIADDYPHVKSNIIEGAIDEVIQGLGRVENVAPILQV